MQPPNMVVTMSSEGQLVIPQSVWEQQGFQQGTEFTVVAGRGGQLLLAPRRKRSRFVASMARLQGLDVPELDHPLNLNDLPRL